MAFEYSFNLHFFFVSEVEYLTIVLSATCISMEMFKLIYLLVCPYLTYVHFACCKGQSSSSRNCWQKTKQSQKKYGLSPGKTRDPVIITCSQWHSYPRDKKILSPRALSNSVQTVEMRLPGSLCRCEHATTHFWMGRGMLLQLDTGLSCFKKAGETGYAPRT